MEGWTDAEAAGLTGSATHVHLLAGSPAVEDFGLELGCEGLHYLHLDQGVLLRTNPLHAAQKDTQFCQLNMTFMKLFQKGTKKTPKSLFEN